MKHTRSGIGLLAGALLAGSVAFAADAGGISADQRARTVTPTADNTVSGNQAQQAMEAPVLVIVPAFYATDVNLASGCWVRLYDKTNYRGTMFTLTGPISIRSLDPGAITGAEFGRNFDSVLVGPSATLTIWDNNDFKDRTASFTPGARVPDLGSRSSYFSEIHSLKLSCSKSSGSGSGSGPSGSSAPNGNGD